MAVNSGASYGAASPTVLLTNTTQAVAQQSNSINFLLREMIDVQTQQLAKQ
jgi:hypothetical protein